MTYLPCGRVTERTEVFSNKQAIEGAIRHLTKPDGYFGVNGVTKGWVPEVVIQSMDGCGCQNKCASAYFDISNSLVSHGWLTGTFETRLQP